MDRPDSLLAILTGGLRVDNLDIAGKHLVDDSGLSVGAGVAVGADTALYLDGDSLPDGCDVGGLASAPGGDVVPGGLDDGLSVGVLEGIVGCD